MIGVELKKHKRMCLELNRAVESLQSERDSVAPSNDREELEEELRSAKADLDAMKQRSGKQRSEVDWESEDARVCHYTLISLVFELMIGSIGRDF